MSLNNGGKFFKKGTQAMGTEWISVLLKQSYSEDSNVFTAPPEEFRQKSTEPLSLVVMCARK